MSMGKKILRMVGVFLAILVIGLIALIAFLSITEYRPADQEDVEITSLTDDTYEKVKEGDTINIVTWNLGYGALGDNADFFMDGGKQVNTATEERVKENMSNIIDFLKSQKADILFLQEVDQDSTRSHHVNEKQDLQEALDGYQATFANNFKVAYVPYPWPPIGKVDSGLLTLNRFQETKSTRISLPCPFKWPIRMANLKRCLLVNRVPIEGSDKELVLVNLHLEAYDDGSGKVAQTKALLKVLNEEAKKGNYVIAGGDFNQTFSNVDASMYSMGEGNWQPGEIDADSFGSKWSLLMDNSEPTCRGLDQVLEGKDLDTFHYAMLDGYIVSKNVKINKIETVNLEFKNSDHNPVALNVTLAED
jgi:endonuclease/exonuclease/phosphatase family metal-dependent hydrolase